MVIVMYYRLFSKIYQILLKQIIIKFSLSLWKYFLNYAKSKFTEEKTCYNFINL